MAGQKSKRRSRKRRTPGAAPRAVPSERREQRAERVAARTTAERRASRTLGTEGERPESPFGGLPISEVAIFAGLVAIAVWLIRGGTATLVVGIVVCGLGVVEVTAREHFSGYRSHASLLAGIPAVGLAIGVVALTGTERNRRGPLLIAIAGPVFGLLFWILRKRFAVARQARATRLRAP